MRKVLVFQHVAHEILGTLHPLLKTQAMRVRYVNFDRQPDTNPSMQKYNGLIVLGGHMGVYEAETYTHIKVEMRLIEEALKKDIPILGICLGAQILAHVLGAKVTKAPQREVGWHALRLTAEGRADKLFDHFGPEESVFQMHGDTFEIPATAVHLATSNLCFGQAFRYGEKVYGLQFHLEADGPMIERWLANPAHQSEIGADAVSQIREESATRLARSTSLSKETFRRFLAMFGEKERRELLGSR